MDAPHSHPNDSTQHHNGKHKNAIMCGDIIEDYPNDYPDCSCLIW